MNNAKAVLEAVFGRVSGFVRTPKYAVVDRKDGWRASALRLLQGSLEAALGVFFTFQLAYVAYLGFFVWEPFLVLMQFGFVYTAFLSIRHGS